MSLDHKSNPKDEFFWNSPALSLQEMNWALTAFAKVAQAMSKSQSIPILLQSICDALTLGSPYVLAWIGLAENSDIQKAN